MENIIEKPEREDLPFFQIAKVNLLALLKLEFNKSLKEELNIVDDWIKNKRCKCAEHKDIQTKRIVLDCKHINKIINENKIIQRADEKINRMSNVLLIRNLLNVKEKLSQKRRKENK